MDCRCKRNRLSPTSHVRTQRGSRTGRSENIEDSRRERCDAPSPPQPTDAKRGRAFALPRLQFEAQTSSRPALEQDSDGYWHDAQRTSLRRNVVVTRFDEGLEDRHRKLDTGACVPAEVVRRHVRRTRGLYGRHVKTSAADEVRGDANHRQSVHEVAGRAHDMVLGATSCLRAERVVRAIDTETNRDDRKVDSQCNGTVVAGVVGFGQVAHWERATASDSKLERLHYAKLRMRDARCSDKCDRSNGEEQ